MRFINKSKNGDRFEWVFLDTLGGIKETATTYGLEEMPEYTYYAADKFYYPSLLSISEEGCEDSTKIEQGIQVVKSQLDIPNVFTPNGDNLHDRWVFKHQSLENCKITVVDRTGKVVYKIKIDDIYSWEGWDGKLHDSDRDAPKGQYYYVVEAMGYDGVHYKDPYPLVTDENIRRTGDQQGRHYARRRDSGSRRSGRRLQYPLHRVALPLSLGHRFKSGYRVNHLYACTRAGGFCRGCIICRGFNYTVFMSFHAVKVRLINANLVAAKLVHRKITQV